MSEGSTPGNSWLGCVARFLQILTLFQNKKYNFPHPFSDQTSKIHTRFQTWRLGRNYVIITWIRARNLKLFKFISVRIFLFLSYSYRIETINTFMHSRSSLENQTWFQSKRSKLCTRFQTKTAQKRYPMGRPPGYSCRLEFKLRCTVALSFTV